MATAITLRTVSRAEPGLMGLSSLPKRSIRGSDRRPPIGRRAPLRVALVDAPDDVHVGAEHAPGEHADLAVPEREAIDRDDRCDLVCRLLLEKIIGDVELGAVDLALDHLEPEDVRSDRLA